MHRVLAICRRYVALALAEADFSEVTALAIDETSCVRGHDYITLAADAVKRRVLSVTVGRDAKAIATIAAELAEHGCPLEQIESVSIDMSPAFIKGVGEQLPNARIANDQVPHRAARQRRGGQDAAHRAAQRQVPQGHAPSRCSRTAPASSPRLAADLDALIARMASVRTARAWVYKERLREILQRKQINVVRAMLLHWCRCVMRSKVEPVKAAATLVRCPLKGIVAWAQTRQTNGFLEAINGLFQAAKRRARGFTRMSTIKTVIFLIVGKLDFSAVNPHAR